MSSSHTEARSHRQEYGGCVNANERSSADSFSIIGGGRHSVGSQTAATSADVVTNAPESQEG
eukprot:m.98527 g.98527  ORF g.98527 m.98527 type:complete len:62 (-) comp20571_c0_seq5:435-620(-)